MNRLEVPQILAFLLAVILKAERFLSLLSFAVLFYTNCGVLYGFSPLGKSIIEHMGNCDDFEDVMFDIMLNLLVYVRNVFRYFSGGFGNLWKSLR